MRCLRQQAARLRNSLASRESIDSRGLEFLFRIETSRRKVLLIGRVREKLGFQAETRSRAIGYAGLPLKAAIQEVSRVELYARRRSKYFHSTPRNRLEYVNRLD